MAKDTSKNLHEVCVYVCMHFDFLPQNLDYPLPELLDLEMSSGHYSFIPAKNNNNQKAPSLLGQMDLLGEKPTRTCLPLAIFDSVHSK